MYGLTLWEERCLEFNRQQRCSHLKGKLGAKPNFGGGLDYNVSIHRFPTGEVRIRCLYNCGFEVWNLPNWRFKWAYAMKMVKNSTNTMTSSEVVFKRK